MDKGMENKYNLLNDDVILLDPNLVNTFDLHFVYKEITNKVESAPLEKYTFDFSLINSVSSKHISLIAKLVVFFKQRNIKFEFKNCNDKIMKVFRIVNMQKICTI